MSPVVAALDETIGALAALDLDALTDGELHDLTVAVQRSQARLAVAAGRCVARWDARRVWASDQSRSAAARLARDVNCSAATAGRELRRARALATVPATAAAITAGDLSMDHVDLLARARHTAPDRFDVDEAVLVEQCAALRFRHAEQAVAYWRLRADPDGTEPEPDRAAAHTTTLLDGSVVVHATLDPLGGATFATELDRLEQAQRLADQRAGTTRTIGQRRAAALVEMATRSATTPAAGRRPRPLFTVLLGDRTFTELCELAAGPVVPPGALLPHLADADLEVVLFDGPTTVVSTSRRRTFTGAVRRAIEVRDRHCQHPAGCDTPAHRCDVDHIDPWSRGRRTDQFNGRLQCATHNRRATHHDTGALPQPARPITRLDELRCRLRWRNHHLYPEPDDDTDGFE